MRVARSFSVVILLFLPACSNNWVYPRGSLSTSQVVVVSDGSTTAETAPGGPVLAPDGASTPTDGAATEGLNCHEVSVCSDECALGCAKDLGCMMQCPTDCNARGCESARPLFSAVNTCVTARCMWKCLGGPTAKCKSCVATRCTTQISACDLHSCPVTASDAGAGHD